MQKLKLFLWVVVALCSACTGNKTKTNEFSIEDGKTQVYYFHTTRRCPTCLAIEKTTLEVLKEDIYAEAIEGGNIKYSSLNVEGSENKSLVNRLQISGSSLVVLRGGEKTDLTSKAFMYALKQPDKLKVALREALND